MNQANVGVKHGGQNPNNSYPDPRIIWEDGQWAIIEAGDCWDGLIRTRSRDTFNEIINVAWDANGPQHMPGAGTIAKKALVKVRLSDLLANPLPSAPAPQAKAAQGIMPSAKDYKKDPVAPPSPFMPKPYGKNIPEYPHTCRACGGRYYQGLMKSIHEATEHGALQGACPGPKAKINARA